jgi:uncharacterized protein (DUF1697 family)
VDGSTPTPTHAAFLRAVNLGGRRRVSSEDLRATFERLGLHSVHTVRTSGNVVFAGAPGGAEGDLQEAIEHALADRFGFAVPVYLRSAAQLRALVATDPFPGERLGPPRKLQVALLARRPSARNRKRVLEHATEDDLLSFGKLELLWLPRTTTQRSSLELREIESLVGPWTMRTMNTMQEIVARHLS